MATKKLASTDASLKSNFRGFDSLILKRYLKWLELKKNNRTHWLGRRKGGLLYLF